MFFHDKYILRLILILYLLINLNKLIILSYKISAANLVRLVRRLTILPSCQYYQIGHISSHKPLVSDISECLFKSKNTDTFKYR